MKGILNKLAQHRAFTPACISAGVVLLALVISLIVNASSDKDDPDPDLDRELGISDSDAEDGWVYGQLEYPHDVLDPRTLFMLLMAHPKSQVPMITGGYAETDVWVAVQIRGIDVPRGLQVASQRHRPHLWLERERRRWDRTMSYIWNVCGNNGIFRVGNFEVLEADKKLKADLEFLLGGQWHDLRTALLNDKMVLPTQTDGTQWDFGALEFGTLNPHIPK